VSPLILDTNIVSYLMKDHPFGQWYRPRLRGHTLAISFTTVAELFEGAFRAGWDEQRKHKLEVVLRSYLVIPSSPGVCRRWGQVRAVRRHSPISPQDAWIAATALEHGCPLVTHNSEDFHDIPGLTLITADSPQP
jgi:tRNA(fMet)-specific endonuclease VapC